MFPVDKKTRGHKKLDHTNVLIPWYSISYLTIASSVFLGGGAYGSLPAAAIWWGLRTGGGGRGSARHGKYAFNNHDLNIVYRDICHGHHLVDFESEATTASSGPCRM